MTDDERTKVKRDQNKKCSQKCLQKKKDAEAKLEEQAESLREEKKALRREIMPLEVDYFESFGNLQDLKDSLQPRESAASKMERGLLEKEIAKNQKGLIAIADRRTEKNKGTNGSQKSRTLEKLNLTKLKLEIHDLELSIEHLQSIRAELKKALGIEDIGTPPPPFATPPDDLVEPPTLMPQGDPRVYFEREDSSNPRQCHPTFEPTNNTTSEDSAPLLDGLNDVPAFTHTVPEHEYGSGDDQNLGIDPMEGDNRPGFNILAFAGEEKAGLYDPLTPPIGMELGLKDTSILNAAGLAASEHQYQDYGQRFAPGEFKQHAFEVLHTNPIAVPSLLPQPGWCDAVPADIGIAAYNADVSLASGSHLRDSGFQAQPGQEGELLVPRPVSTYDNNSATSAAKKAAHNQNDVKRSEHYGWDSPAPRGADGALGYQTPVSLNYANFTTSTTETAENKTSNSDNSQLYVGAARAPSGQKGPLSNQTPVSLIDDNSVTSAAKKAAHDRNDFKRSQLQECGSQAPRGPNAALGVHLPVSLYDDNSATTAAAKAAYDQNDFKQSQLHGWDSAAPRGLAGTLGDQIPVYSNYDNYTTSTTVTAGNKECSCDDWQLHVGAPRAPSGWQGLSSMPFHHPDIAFATPLPAEGSIEDPSSVFAPAGQLQGPIVPLVALSGHTRRTTRASSGLHRPSPALEQHGVTKEGQKASRKRKNDPSDGPRFQPSPTKIARGGTTMAAVRGICGGSPTPAPRNTHTHTHTGGSRP